MFEKGLYAGHEAGLSLALSMIVTRHNAHEVDQMRAMAERLGLPFDEYVNMVPTIYGGAETLPSQSAEHLRKRKVFTGCNAGHTFFHVDPHGRASICKVGRDPQISLMDEGVEGLNRLGGIADGLLLRQGGCTGCTHSGTCGRVIWFHSTPHGARTRLMLKTFSDQDKRHCGHVMDLQDRDVADTFAGFAQRLRANGFAFLYQRIKAGLSDGPILVTVDDRHIVGAIGPLGILPDATGTPTQPPQYFAVHPDYRHRGHGHGTVAGGNGVGRRERCRVQNTPSRNRERR